MQIRSFSRKTCYLNRYSTLRIILAMKATRKKENCTLMSTFCSLKSPKSFVYRKVFHKKLKI